MRPLPSESRQKIFELRQLDLQLALIAARSLGKNIQDELTAVHHPNLKRILQIALLSRRQFFIDNNQIGVKLFYPPLNLVHLPPADQRCRSNALDLLMLLPEDRRTRGFR